MNNYLIIIAAVIVVIVASITTIPAFIACWPNSLVLGDGLFWAYATGMCD